MPERENHMKQTSLLVAGLLCLATTAFGQAPVVPGPPAVVRGWVAALGGTYSPNDPIRVTYRLQITKVKDNLLPIAGMNTMHDRLLVSNPDGTINKLIGTEIIRVLPPLVDFRRLNIKLNQFSIIQDMGSLAYSAGDVTSPIGSLQIFVTLPTGYSVENASVVAVPFPDNSTPYTLTDAPKIVTVGSVSTLEMTLTDTTPNVPATFEPIITHTVTFTLVQTAKAATQTPPVVLMTVKP